VRLHLVALPHTRVSRDFATCAYTQKALKFSKMMAAVGHEVVLYAPEGSDESYCELVPCLSETERVATFGWDDPNRLPFWPTDEQFSRFNVRAAYHLRERYERGDLVLLASGWSQRSIAEALPDALCCEPFVGYEGILTPYCAFESHAWRHFLYGKWGIGDGRWYDEVIPNYFDPADFDVVPRRGDYLLFVGRLIGRKGVHVAGEIAQAAGMKLVVAGPGAVEVEPGRIASAEVTLEGDVEYVGTVGIEERAELMAGAYALLAPTVYVEPFGGVAVEAMLSGTPAITTPWGAFSETVEPGLTGYHFRTLEDGLEAVELAGYLEPARIRRRALERFSLATVGGCFDSWFSRLGTLFGDGWYTRDATWRRVDEPLEVA
jgi:glycosyltransferase involved in cell wall biosynthesis